MRSVDIEAILWIMAIVICVALPVFIGFGVLKIYFHIYPPQESKIESIADIGAKNPVRFSRIFIIGWAICGPIYLWLYLR